MTDFLQDLRYALRTFKRSAGLTFVVVASLAIGIGANTAVFSVVNALLLKPLPYPAPDAANEPPRTEAHKNVRILLAEDNPVNQKLATRLLERNGHSVRVARDGGEAVALAAEGTFELILMDVQMPKMDGYTATRRIREREGAANRVPIVAMTACAMKGDREKCLDAGMDAYVPKPIEIDALLAVIAKMGSVR